ncbi:molybdenum cofactor guanylyltransferase [Aliidiomarina halalkaliphila]|uniref:Molybdenum cofactor guanylyltransferase n=1 Tax=Aliidiomarina halalkaliphila TaxID=2593535 RepID=A0A552X3K7_9GAMM|nr:molybdenum cofactor guanylyltransferase [Aliidiomarina halalkaliphila]TRW49624.1 molybdenum cofactor guanylyltransferase [Aliidiomarina halalkaliphila]
MGSDMNLSCVLLAGGKSSRMGVDKALLPLSGAPGEASVTLLDYMLSLIVDSGIRDIVVSRNPKLREPNDGSSYLWVDDQTPNRGPLGGILSCIPHCRHDRILIVPVDMPGLSVSSIQQLINVPDSSYFAQSALPCVLRNSDELITALTELLKSEENKSSIRALLERVEARAIASDTSLGDLSNLNTPMQWEAFASGKKGTSADE